MRFQTGSGMMARLAVILMTVSFFAVTEVQAQTGRIGKCLKCHRGRATACPQCDQEFCTLKCEETEVEKKCFTVGFKTICIPKIVPPWKQDCSQPRCARTRSVKVLKTKKYKCPSCKYSWELVQPEVVPLETKPLTDFQPQLENYDQAPTSGSALPPEELHVPESGMEQPAEKLLPEKSGHLNRFRDYFAPASNQKESATATPHRGS